MDAVLRSSSHICGMYHRWGVQRAVVTGAGGLTNRAASRCSGQKDETKRWTMGVDAGKLQGGGWKI